jgi:hypothetical protein
VADSKIYNLWKKVLLRNPDAYPTLQHLIDDADLTQEEREILEKEWRDSSVSAAKYKKHIYGADVETIGDAAEVEHNRSLERQRDTIREYKKDVLGSYTTAKEDAYAGGGGFFDDADRRSAFITRARAIAMQEFENNRRDELDDLTNKYNIPKSQIRSDVVDALDIPVSVAAGIGRDIGEIAGTVQNEYAAAASGVLGEDSALGKGVDTSARVLEGFRDDIKAIYAESPWITKKLRKLRDAGKKPKDLKEINGFFDGIQVLYSSHLRGFLGDLADILDEWYHDPRTLCCFIKNIAALGNATRRAQIFAGEWDSKVDDLRRFFDKIIVILKIIRQFLQQDLAYSFMLTIDLGFMIAKASVSSLVAFLVALQQMIEDAIYYEMLVWLERQLRDENWRQCFPFERLLRLLADFLTGPDGLFKYIGDYINSFMAGFSTDMNYGFNLAKKQKMIDITAIDRLIEMIEMIRDGLLNLELCIEADFRETEELHDDANRAERNVGFTGDSDKNYLKDRVRDKLRMDGDSIPGGSQLTQVVFPTDNEVKTFVMNRLGESEAFADQVIDTANQASTVGGVAAGSTDGAGQDLKSAIDQLQKSIGDCSRTLNSDKILELSKMMSSWDLTL